jgi:hypothetical protein
MVYALCDGFPTWFNWGTTNIYIFFEKVNQTHFALRCCNVWNFLINSIHELVGEVKFIDLFFLLLWACKHYKGRRWCEINKIKIKDWQKVHHKFNMWWVNNENHVKFVHSYVHTFCTWISCIENMFDTWINVLMDEVWTFEWKNVTQIFHLPIILCVKCAFNTWY